jgi:glycosyltransferase involved in cell wall biosynthesis
MTTTPLKLNWHGHGTPFGGYGNANLQWSTALEKITKGGVTIGFGKLDKSDPDVYNALTGDQRKLWVEKPYHKERLGVIKSIPNLFYQNKNKVRVGFTMIENTKIGEEWVRFCNEMDYIFVPNKDNKQSFIDCGVTRPIFVVRQGFNPDQFKYVERTPNKDKFTFSLSGFLDDRKNWQDVTRAFCSEFNNNENVELLLKNSNPAFGYWVPNDKRIKIIDTMFTPQGMRKFYEITDCFMFTTRGEGSGLPAREAMATGAPSILTNYQGLAEVADSRYNYPINPVALDWPDRRPEQPGFMARLDISEIMYWMRYVYSHQIEAFAKGKLAAEWMRKNWNWSKCAKEMSKILETL